MNMEEKQRISRHKRLLISIVNKYITRKEDGKREKERLIATQPLLFGRSATGQDLGQGCFSLVSGLRAVSTD